MKRFLSAGLVLLLAAPAFCQTPEIQKDAEARLQARRQQQKAAVAYLQKLQQKEGGFAADADQSRSSLRATNAAVRALQYLGGDVPDRAACADFVKSCFDKEAGAFADQPGGKPDVTTAAVGALAAAELKLPADPYETGVAQYLGDNVKTFEDIRIAAAAFEAMGKRPAQADAWLEQIAKLRNDDGTYGKDGVARETGGAAAAVLRLGGKVEHEDAVLHAMRDGQRADGGFGKADSPASDLESTYRVMRAFHMLKAAPADVGRLRAFLDACRNGDGGYGVAAGKPSSASGTYYASIILHWLDEK